MAKVSSRNPKTSTGVGFETTTLGLLVHFENLGCAKIKGTRNGSDARKLEAREIMEFWGCAKIRGAVIKGAKIKGARKFKGIR